MKIVLYDLSILPTTFDFACTAVIAKSMGYEEVMFLVDKPMTTWKYPADIGWRRWANILVPMCRLADLSFSVGCSHNASGDVFGYTTGHVVEVFKKTGKITKLKNVPLTENGYVTITMRQSFRNRWRNSNIPEWEKVAKWLGDRGENVVILEEAEHQPMSLEYRMALYCNAKMNLAVGNGPMVLCWLSEAPYLSFQLPKGTEKEYNNLVQQWENMKFPVGSQLPWKTDKQEIVWGPDDFETITSHYNKHFPIAEKVTQVV